MSSLHKIGNHETTTDWLPIVRDNLETCTICEGLISFLTHTNLNWVFCSAVYSGHVAIGAEHWIIFNYKLRSNLQFSNS